MSLGARGVGLTPVVVVGKKKSIGQTLFSRPGSHVNIFFKSLAFYSFRTRVAQTVDVITLQTLITDDVILITQTGPVGESLS